MESTMDSSTTVSSTTDSTPRPVIVVGAGPTGLLLAGDLAAAGVPVTLVEKRPPEISNLSRAFGLHARSLEQLDARGLAEPLEAIGRPLDRIRFFGLALDFATLPSRFRHVLVLPQYEVEKVLRRRAEEAGAVLRFGTEVTGLRQDAEGVTVTVRRADGTPEDLRAAYVVGTDGVHSAVRDAVGLPFPGRAVIRSVVIADVRLAEEPEGQLVGRSAAGAFVVMVPFGDGYHRVVGWHREHNVPESEPVGLAEVEELVRLVTGRDFGLHDPRWLSRFHSEERQVPAYRVGRVFLAGDAAHVHSPAGGQGMNTGLQDAANLSWKLAAVLHGRAPETLLDTYHGERHPVGRAVLRSSGGMIRLAMAGRPWSRALRSLAVAALDHAGPVQRRAAGLVTGLAYAYAAPRGAHRLTGTRVPDVALAGGGRLYEALRGGRFVLITADGHKGAEDRADRLAAERWASGRRTAVLVRPDGYAAWAAEDPTPAATEAALAAHVG
ncbi:FAD-dependent monooxygenase [Streptomyces griseoviridis]|uniref:2-polyprenyl-6-methoxyphenol hydroxylase-like FAD-dependent oxidoreductase n=1 Tax=Streptomyces griseoviridis TaxID=45398 RepID=A0ABT9LH52_STRGD|nr:2-polyprenyl-6-methoxyphenol hydroxylase-like FAD-dependent oxidoreductase [Streptomyces griseoviridis]GGS71976.1 FAD-dependent oxidoreductase [Streptomyces griseoviridis]